MPRILMFDSGVGGLSILREVLDKLPEVHIRYLMDNQLFPYGIQPDDVLVERIVKLCVQHSQQCDLVVMACNTASTIVLPALRDALRIPVVGVVPAIKTAANHSKSGCIGLLATPATVNRHYIDRLIADHAPDINVVRLGSSELVKLAEESFIHGQLDHHRLAEILAPLSQIHDLDQLVLGCTHFPLLKEAISQHLAKVELTDSGEAIARRCAYLLAQHNDDAQPDPQAQGHQLIATKMPEAPDALQRACEQLAPFQPLQIMPL